MHAVTVVPGQPSTAGVEERPEPPESQGAVLVEGLLMGVCGTDSEVVHTDYGQLPDGEKSLVLGHESLGRVRSAPSGSPVAAGDLVIGIVRRPDPVPCPWCARLEWDMCSNGLYTERGIKGADGYGSSTWRVEPDYAIKVDPELGDNAVLLEPTAVVAKVWEQMDAIGHRSTYLPKTALVTGAGPVGLLAAMLAVQRGLEVHVLDRVTDGLKPQLVADLGATYHHGSVGDLGFAPDLIFEGTGSGQLWLDCLAGLAPNGIMGLAGISGRTDPEQAPIEVLNKRMVLNNQVVVGSVNEAHRHYEQAGAALKKADAGWLSRLITRKVPIGEWTKALDKGDDDVKVVIDLQA